MCYKEINLFISYQNPPPISIILFFIIKLYIKNIKMFKSLYKAITLYKIMQKKVKIYLYY